jgi:alpha-beta hydrolase superfamily lysophospholipase
VNKSTPRGTRRPTALVTGVVGLGAVAALASVAGAAFVTAVARKVVTPPVAAAEGLRVLAVGVDTVTLSATPESRQPGNYGLWFARGSGHARIGRVVTSTKRTVTRELLGVDSGRLTKDSRARIGGWFYSSPAALDVASHSVWITTPVGEAPAWLIPAPGDPSTWMIAVHGRGVRRAETLRAVPVFRRNGYTSLLVSYRNDGDAPASDDGLYALGDTEWEDVDAAMAYALDHGATSLVLMGWSMGGATVLQAATRSPHAHAVRGIVLESPVVDWVTALRHQGRALGPANPFRTGALQVISRSWGGRMTGQLRPIDLGRLDFVGRAGELAVPILLMHSSDDTYVPVTASRALAKLRKDIVTYEEFTVAGHTKLWNYDAARWEGAIDRWLRALAGTSANT